MSALGVLDAALNTAWLPTVAGSVLLGHIFHLLIQPLEVDLMPWRLLGGLLCLPALVLVGYVNIANFDMVSALLRTAAVSAAFSFGLVSSILLYRTFFHRLRRFPGPLGAKLSRFYLFNKVHRNCQGHLVTDQFHQKYGDFVRLGKPPLR